MNQRLIWLKRSLHEASKQIWRNKALTFSSIFLGGISVFFVNLVFGMETVSDSLIHDLEKKATYALPLNKDPQGTPRYDPTNYEGLRSDLSKKYQVKVSEIPAKHPLPAQLYLEFESLEAVYDVFDKELTKPRYSEIFLFQDRDTQNEFLQIVKRLIKIRTAQEQISFLLLFTFLGTGILLMLNSFRVFIEARKEEVYVARLVGAEDHFITGPFFMEGIFIGIGAAIFGNIIFFSGLINFDPLHKALKGSVFDQWWNTVFWPELILVPLVCGLTAWIACKTYLNRPIE